MMVGCIENLLIMLSYRYNYQNCNLFVYCGHGAGENMVDSYKLRKMCMNDVTSLSRLDGQQQPFKAAKNDSLAISCRGIGAALLWGCSSGKLERRGIHDPTGAALHYLLAGAPFIISNLWDVTDRDIDRLSMCCMMELFDPLVHSETQDIVSAIPNPSVKMRSGISPVCEALDKSRDVCKMIHAVGSAPVV